MTTPTVFSDVANNENQGKFSPSGVLSQKAIVAVPATTAAATNLGLIRFQPGFTLLSLAIVSDDLDTGAAVTLDVGYLYDGTTGEDSDAFFTGLDIAQDAGSRTWPVDDGLLTGLSFEATDDGYISVTTAGGPTTTAGNITVIATFSYDA